MSVDSFRNELETLSGVKHTRVVTNNDERVLRVDWDGRPNDYAQYIGELKEKHDIKQVETPTDNPEETPDAMPILYFAAA